VGGRAFLVLLLLLLLLLLLPLLLGAWQVEKQSDGFCCRPSQMDEGAAR